MNNRWMGLLCALLLAPGLASAQVLTRAPELQEFVQAEYPPAALEQKLAGDVILEVDIGEDGSVLDARVTGPAGNGFDEAALAAVKQFRFTPAEIDGKPAAVTIEYRYSFSLPAAPVEAPAEAEEVAKPGIVNLRGQVVERGSKRPIPGATVDVNDGAALATTDEQGRFEATDLPVGQVKVVVVDSSHERFETTETIEEGKATEVTYYVLRRPTSPYEANIIGKRERKEVSTVAISKPELERIPGTSGDTVKVVQNLPGVARSPYGTGQLLIRGGYTNESLTYVDGVQVPQVFHFGALSAVYASELVQEVQYEPGNFGARYGRATAGRVELVTRRPERKQLHLVADVDLYDGTALVEGPVNDKLSVSLAARRSWVDAVINAAAAASPDAFGDVGFAVAPRYYDWQAKIGYEVDAQNELKLDFFGSDDALALVGVDSGGVEKSNSLSTTTRFWRLGLTWDNKPDEDTRVHVQLFPGYNSVGVSFAPLFFNIDRYSVDGRAEVYRDLSKSFVVGGGLDVGWSQQRVQVALPRPTPRGQIPPPTFDDRLVSADIDVGVVQPAIWTEAIWSPWESVKLVPGLRVDYDSFIERTWVDPRFSARWALTDKTTVKGAVGLYHRAPDAQYATVEFGNPDIIEEGSTQYMIGAEQRILGPVSADLQLYYKDLFDLVSGSNRVIVRNGEEVPERYSNRGSGKAWGADLLLRYDPDGRFFGWIAYSLSRVERIDPDSQTGAGAAEFDQPHNLVVLGSWELPELWNGLSFGFKARYTTGAPKSRVAGAVFDVDAGDYRSLPLPRSADDRLPDFFQLDVRVDKRWTFDTATLTAYLDIQNVTNRENSEAVDYSYDYSKSQFTPGLPFFPSFGLRWEY